MAELEKLTTKNRYEIGHHGVILKKSLELMRTEILRQIEIAAYEYGQAICAGQAAAKHLDAVESAISNWQTISELYIPVALMVENSEIAVSGEADFDGVQATFTFSS